MTANGNANSLKRVDSKRKEVYSQIKMHLIVAHL